MEKTKQTLYNFVSLRSPQLVKKEEKDIRFIKHPEDITDKVLADLKRKLATLNSNGDNLAAFVDDGSKGFSTKAQEVAEQKGSLNYTTLMIILDAVTTIPEAKAKILFISLIENFNSNTNEDFDLKERICDWLLLWHLKKKFDCVKEFVDTEVQKQKSIDKKQKTDSFLEEGSEDKFRNNAGKELIYQILTATIILPTSKELQDNEKSLAIQTNGPAKIILEASEARGQSTFVLSDKLKRDHETSLANLQLQAFEPDDANKLLLQEKILNNTLFTTRKFFFAGSAMNTNAGQSASGIAASIIQDPKGSSILFITPSGPLENNAVPYRVKIKLKYTDEFKINTPGNDSEPIDLSNEIPIVKNGRWYIKTETLADLKNDCENFFIELIYPADVKYIAALQINRFLDPDGKSYYEGSGALYKASSFQFKATIKKNKEGTEWNLNLAGIGSIVNANSKPVKIAVLLTDEYGSLAFGIPSEKLIIGANDLFEFALQHFDTNVQPRNFNVFISIQFANGKTYFSLPFKIYWKNAEEAKGDSFFLLNDGLDAYGKTYTPKGFGIKQLGVADYQRVVSHVTRYEAGEVANIENLMAREYREKVITKEHITEITEFESLETETEHLNDATSAERFQMQTEIAKIQQEQNNTTFDAHASYNGGTSSLSVNYGNATNTSRQESNKQAATSAQELTKRAMERIVTKVKKERTVKVTDKLTDVSKHGFDNRGGADHVSGVYRYVNAIYKNEIENYGKRLAYEFAIPQPSKLHHLGLQANMETDSLETLEKPLDPRKLKLDPMSDKFFTWEYLTEKNYTDIAQQYDANVTDYPQAKFTAVSFKESDFSSSDEYQTSVTADPNYVFKSVRVYVGTRTTDVGTSSYDLAFGTDSIINQAPYKTNGWTKSQQHPLDLKPVDQLNSLIISANTTSVPSINFTIILKSESANDKPWKKEVFQQIIEAYEERLKEYNEKVEALKQSAKESSETNPLNFRQIEQTILRMNCISYLIAPYGEFLNRNFGKNLYLDAKDSSNPFASTRINNSRDLDEYSAFVKFIEQAFEWNIMSYNFYPFYWGNAGDWKDLYQSDYNDPLFKNFMQAGMARVVVTVRPGFERAVLLYMVTGKIWAGGHIPVYGDPLYVSMANELKEPEYKIKESWETVLPTNLLALQRGGAIINMHGLPNLEKPSIKEDDDEFAYDPKAKQIPIIKNDEGPIPVEDKKMAT